MFRLLLKLSYFDFMSLFFVTGTYADSVRATYSDHYVIIDLQMMNERQYDSNRDRTAIGYISPEIFKDRSSCLDALVDRYAGNVWDIEKTKNPHRSGEMRLHQYGSELTYKSNGTAHMRKEVNAIRFCVNTVLPEGSAPNWYNDD